MRRMTTAALATIALLAGACGGATTPQTLPTTTASPTVSPTASDSPTPEPRGPSVVYASHPLDVSAVTQDLFVWDATSNTRRRLTLDGSKNLERYPVFRTPDLVTYSVDGTLYQIPVAGGPATRLLKVPGFIASVEWTANGSTAWILGNDFEGPRDTLYRYSAADGLHPAVRTFRNPCGRGPGFDDDFSLHLSPDETQLLMVETCLEPSVYVMTVNVNPGSNVIDPLWGTFARWSADGKSIYVKGYEKSKNVGKWMKVEAATGATSPLAFREQTFGLAVSPDGRWVAYHTGGEEPVLYAVNLETGAEQKLATGYAGALWISDDALVAARVGACDDVETCGEAFWEIKGEGTRVDVTSGGTQTVNLRGTHWFEGYSEQSDALLG